MFASGVSVIFSDINPNFEVYLIQLSRVMLYVE